jgi:hypothetical protein
VSGNRAPKAANVAARGTDRRTRAAQATSEAGPATSAASAGSVMTPVPRTAPTERAVPWATVSVPWLGCGSAVRARGVDVPADVTPDDAVPCLVDGAMRSMLRTGWTAEQVRLPTTGLVRSTLLG